MSQHLSNDDNMMASRDAPGIGNRQMLHGPRLQFSSAEVQLLEELFQARARESFLDFRRYIRPQLKVGWWVAELAEELQIFYDDLVAGKRPKLALMAPPQHGKSLTVTDFIAYVAGRDPNKKTIFASFNDELGIGKNLDLQRSFSSPSYQRIFSQTRIGLPGWQCNTSLIEYAGCSGSFRNTTVNGAINGMELHLGVIDDPVKGRQEASSKLVRDRTWDWFNDDFLTRFAKDAGMLIVMTRWHVDDLLGRLIERHKDVKVLRYPAIAKVDTNRRKKGEALFPELKPLDFLLERKNTLTQASWEALYQQHPIVVGGGVLPIEKLRVLPVWNRNDVLQSVRYVDKAGTEGGEGAYTAAVLMHSMANGTYVISHVARGRWSALEREQRIRELAESDSKLYGNYVVVIEQEPGSGGKESAESTIRTLSGFAVWADRVTGSKQVRAEPFCAQVQAGNVGLVAGDWVRDLLDECECWPAGRYSDQVDAAAGAFNRLAPGEGYNYNLAQWV